MIDWNTVDWTLVWDIAGSTWIITVLVCFISWIVAWTVGLWVRKTLKPTTEEKKTPGKA